MMMKPHDPKIAVTLSAIRADRRGSSCRYRLAGERWRAPRLASSGRFCVVVGLKGCLPADMSGGIRSGPWVHDAWSR